MPFCTAHVCIHIHTYTYIHTQGAIMAAYLGGMACLLMFVHYMYTYIHIYLHTCTGSYRCSVSGWYGLLADGCTAYTFTSMNTNKFTYIHRQVSYIHTSMKTYIFTYIHRELSWQRIWVVWLAC